ncbi:hypothetical protein CR513_36210, partial [Mucuna pruriens]
MAMKLYDSRNKPELYVLFLHTSYSMKKDSATCYDIESKIFNFRQGTLSVTEYYGTLNGLWIEERIFNFLHGWNSEYDPIRIHILGKKKLSSLSKSKETQRLVMLDKGNLNTRFAMVTRKGPIKRSTFEGKPFTKSSREEYYTITNDQDIPRIPATRFMKRRKFLNEWVEIKAQLKCGKEEMDLLRALLNSTSKPLGSCGLTMKVPQSIWILDYGAIDHITPFPSYFTSYLKVSKKQLITVANRDHVPIVGSGNVQLHSSLSQHNVLYVPKLANNLISIHRLIQD